MYFLCHSAVKQVFSECLIQIYSKSTYLLVSSTQMNAKWPKTQILNLKCSTHATPFVSHSNKAFSLDDLTFMDFFYCFIFVDDYKSIVLTTKDKL